MTRFQKLQLWALPLAMTLIVVQFGISVAFAFNVPGSALPTDGEQAFDLFGMLWKFIVEKNYAAAAGPALTLIVWGLKKYDLVIFNALKLPKVATAVDTFLDKPFVSFLLPTVIAGVTGGVTALVTGHSFVDALNAIWQTSSTAIATYVGLKKAAEQLDAGKTAAAAVDTKAEAINELKKP